MRCGLLGEHLGHSYSPQIHALLGDYSYTLFEIPPEKLEAFLKSDCFDALNVTIPYKKSVIPFCSELSQTARRMGSVNTLLRRKDGTLYGDNTDFDGFSWPLSRNGGIRPGEKALVFGTGGASLTVQEVLRDRGANVIALSRHGENNYSTLPQHSDAVLAVNATPVGMYPNNGQRLVDLSLLPNLRCVLDLIYNPARPQLLLDAEARSIRSENGLSMLVAQAKRAAELFTGRTIPDRRCEEILCKLQLQMQNIILIGMPGCGKSTVGGLLAQALGRPFVDADKEIEKAVGCDILSFFSKKGEAAFREEETKVLSRLGKRSGCVIATGGGCVTRPENYPLLHQNGTIFWLRRELSRLPTDNRPISQSTPMQTLYEQRKALYESFCDKITENQAEPIDAVRAILAAIGQEGETT